MAYVLDFMVRPERFELPTPWFVAKYSIQMSYGRASRALYQKLKRLRNSCPLPLLTANRVLAFRF